MPTLFSLGTFPSVSDLERALAHWLRPAESAGPVTSRAAARPYPWASLESLSKADAVLLRDARAWGADFLRLHELESVMGTLLKTTVQLHVRRVQTLRASQFLPNGYGILLKGDDGASALLQVEADLAGAITARALDRQPAIFQRRDGPSVPIAGALAAVVAATVRRASWAAGLQIVSAGAAEDEQSKLLGTTDEWAAIGFTVTMGDDAYLARLIVGRISVAIAHPQEWTAERLAALGATPLSMPLVSTSFCLSALDLATLRPGDALLPSTWPLHRSKRGGLAGPLLLAAPTATVGVMCDVSEDGVVMLVGNARALSVGEVEMSESDQSASLVAAVGDVPVLVRVEVGEARMAARDWAALGRGDIIPLGRRVGERVLLRVSGVPVASGELVDLEGEVGVRIVERLNMDKTSP